MHSPKTIRALLVLLVLSVAAAFAAEEAAPAEDDFVPPEGLHDGWYARIDTTLGRILVRLHPEQAPQAVTHFARLAMGEMPWLDVVTGEEHTGHYYDGVPVHAAVAMERFEVGDRSGTGHGAPHIYMQNEGAGPVNFSQGWRLGMTVGAGSKISAVQFFVISSSQPLLNGRHPCFGTVIAGKDVVDRITNVKTYSNNRPVDPPVVEKIRVFSVGEVEPLAEPELYKPHPRQLELNDPFSK